MKRTLLVFVLGLIATLALTPSSGAAKQLKTPKGFFGVGPQDAITDEDAAYMRAGGVESIRIGLNWSLVQPTEGGDYDWSGLDDTLLPASRAGIQVLPFVYGTPSWLTADWRKFPISSGRQRSSWRTFLRAAVKRYKPGGQYWREHAPGVAGGDQVISRPLPIRTWQIGNEVNFFYFAKPISPGGYARLVKLSSQAIKSVDRSARIVLSGLFGEPDEQGPRGMDAVHFLNRVYRKRGIKRYFDGIALHPYAVDAKALKRMVEGVVRVAKRNGDRPDLYLTEFGWGSENNFNQVAFEQGPRGQVKQLRASYRYLVKNQHRLRVKETYWFSWKDRAGSCNFCDSVGLFREGPGFKAKPSWRAFVKITGGRARP